MNCPVCNASDSVLIRNYHSGKAIFQSMNLVRCSACSMVYADPMPSDEILTEYNASYFVTAHGGLTSDPVATAFFSGIAWVRIGHIKRYLKKFGLTVKKILEIGPGSGYFAGNWLKLQPETKYDAIETDTSCHELLRKLGVHVTGMDEIKTNKISYDLMVLSHVVEHVSRPKEFLTAMSSCIKKGGVIFIEVPCRDWEHKSADEPHLLFFEKKSMMELLTSLGFSNIQLSYHGQTIEKLKLGANQLSFLQKVRVKLLNKGLSGFASLFYKGARKNMKPLEMAAIDSYEPHIEHDEPSWWLRAVAQK